MSDPISLEHHQYPLELRYDARKGRGVYARDAIPRNTCIEVSPILHFRHDEYDAHGKHTVLDHYTYRWKDGFALALGLGSMFNHAKHPNVGFVRDMEHGVIRYITLEPIDKDSELCISYGSHLWFPTAEDESESDESASEEDDPSWWNAIQLDEDDQDGPSP